MLNVAQMFWLHTFNVLNEVWTNSFTDKLSVLSQVRLRDTIQEGVLWLAHWRGSRENWGLQLWCCCQIWEHQELHRIRRVQRKLVWRTLECGRCWSRFLVFTLEYCTFSYKKIAAWFVLKRSYLNLKTLNYYYTLLY